jgi:hypothetical protein
LDWNGSEWQSGKFKELESSIRRQIAEKQSGTEDAAAEILKNLAN